MRYQSTHYTNNQGLAFSETLSDNERMLNIRERRALAAKADVKELIDEYGMDNTGRLLDVHRTTVSRWHSGEIIAPVAVILALRAAVWGQLPGMNHKWWRGWKFGLDGYLYSDAGQQFHPGDMLARQYERALIASLQNQVKELEADLARAVDHARHNDAAANDMMIHRVR